MSSSWLFLLFHDMRFERDAFDLPLVEVDVRRNPVSEIAGTLKLLEKPVNVVVPMVASAVDVLEKALEEPKKSRLGREISPSRKG
jgi:hypothetical protein